MADVLNLTKADARRAMVRYHFAPSPDLADAFERLRSVQFDPIAPIGCNHDLVLQARVPGYRVDDWAKFAYEDRRIYDGWDKQASLVPFEGWPLRRFICKVHRAGFEKKIFEDHKDAVEAILKDLEARGPLMPKECGFQERREDWKGSWLGASVAKQTLRALWHSGMVMTSGRRGGQHLYDLTERVVPAHLLSQPVLTDEESIRELVLERHRAMGLLKPVAGPEIWSYSVLRDVRKPAIAELVRTGQIIPVSIEGVKAHATPEFLRLLDQPPLDPRVVFVAPLDPFLWDRKMTGEIFGFEYSWEIYTPEAKRRWGYYVLPILFGDGLVARVEFACRQGILELREWHQESLELEPKFWPALERAAQDLMAYASAKGVSFRDHIPSKVKEAFRI